MDVVYVVRRGDMNDELRWSLRSVAAKVPHERVWIVGYAPEWVRGCEVIRTHQKSTKNRNSTANVKAACKTAAISDPFLLVNDDMFIMERQPEVFPALHRGRVDDVVASFKGRGVDSPYLDGMVQTRDLLAGFGYSDLLSYELHVPIVVHKAAMLAALELGQSVPIWHKRTAYGALADFGGTQIEDVKVCSAHPEWDESAPYLSTDDESFAVHKVGEFIRDRFAERGPYERGPIFRGLSNG